MAPSVHELQDRAQLLSVPALIDGLIQHGGQLIQHLLRSAGADLVLAQMEGPVQQQATVGVVAGFGPDVSAGGGVECASVHVGPVGGVFRELDSGVGVSGNSHFSFLLLNDAPSLEPRFDVVSVFIIAILAGTGGDQLADQLKLLLCLGVVCVLKIVLCKRVAIRGYQELTIELRNGVVDRVRCVSNAQGAIFNVAFVILGDVVDLLHNFFLFGFPLSLCFYYTPLLAYSQEEKAKKAKYLSGGLRAEYRQFPGSLAVRIFCIIYV
nr:MAG TPA: hypothetical protein [Caudoviricetes sp.]